MKLAFYGVVFIGVIVFLVSVFNSKGELFEMLSGVGESIKSMRPFDKRENYLNIDSVDEDNTLFEDEKEEKKEEEIKVDVSAKKKEEEKKEEEHGINEDSEEGKLNTK